MSRGSQDTFSVIAHWIDVDLKRYSVILKMIQMESTRGIDMALKFEALLVQYDLKTRVIANVADGGTNFNTCTRALEGIVTCDYDSCWAHIMSNVFKRSLYAEHHADLDIIDLQAISTKLQSAITWTKTSGKGSRLWAASSLKAKLAPVKLYSLVKTRFGSVFIMMNQILKYKDAVHFFYSDPTNMANSHRDISNAQWAVIRFVLRVMRPVVDACVFNQSHNIWCVSDSIVLAFELIEQYKPN